MEPRVLGVSALLLSANLDEPAPDIHGSAGSVWNCAPRPAFLGVAREGKRRRMKDIQQESGQQSISFRLAVNLV